MGVPACADLLHVSERTIRGWESGATRIPYAAYKLLRLLRGGKVLGPAWRDFYVRGELLVTPEGHTFHFGELAWHSLLIRQARMFRELLQVQRQAAAGHPRRPAPALEAPGSSGLVYSSTSGTLLREMASERGSHVVEAARIQEPESAPATLPGLRPARGPGGGLTGQRLAAALLAAGGAA